MAARSGEVLGDETAGISGAQAISTVSDVSLSRISRGIYVGGAGTLVVQFAGDPDSNPITLLNLVAGVWHPMQIQKIISSGTTATGVVAGF